MPYKRHFSGKRKTTEVWALSVLKLTPGKRNLLRSLTGHRIQVKNIPTDFIRRYATICQFC